MTFQDNLEEYTIPEGSWSVRPLLGYDWIAGEYKARDTPVFIVSLIGLFITYGEMQA